jgi:chromosome segregation ATPase
MFESVLKRPESSASGLTVRLTYLSGPSAETDFTVSRQLGSLSDSLKVIKVDTVTEALAELQKPEGDYQAVAISPALTEQEAVAAIHAIRKDEPVVTILPVVADQSASDAMLSAGATDVMLFANGTLTDPFDTVGRVTRLSADATSNRVVGAAKKKIRNLFSAMRPGQHGDDHDVDRRRLQARLNQIRVNAEASAQQALEEAQRAPQTDMVALNRDATAKSDPASRKRRSTDTFTRAEYETAVNSVRLELARVVDEHAFERAAWEKTFQLFEQQLNEIRAEAESKAELEAALTTAQDKLQETVEASDDERTAWKGIREELEARLHQRETRVDRVDFDAAVGSARAETAEVQGRLDAALAAAEREQRRAAETLASERTAWDAARRQLEGAAQAAQTKLKAADEESGKRATELEGRSKALGEVTEARGRLEAALAESETELRKTSDAYAADRTSWTKARHQLEAVLQENSAKLKAAERQAAELAARTKELREAAETRADLERSLTGTQEDLREAGETLAAERAAWGAARQALEAAHAKTVDDHAAELEARANELQTAAETRAKLEDALSRTQTDLQKITEARSAEQAGWAATRQDLDAAQTKAAERHATELDARAHELQEADETRAKLEDALARAQAELHKTTEAHAAERTRWTATQQDFEAAQAQAVGTRTKLEAALADAKAERQKDFERHAEERRAWEESRRELDSLAGQWQSELQQAASLHESEAAGRATDRKEASETIVRLEAALATAQADHHQAAEHHESARAEWSAARQQLEADVKNARAALVDAEQRGADLDTRVNDLRKAAKDRTKVESALAEARAEHQKDVERHDSESRGWETIRRQLEQDVTSARANLKNAADQHAVELAGRVKELRDMADSRAALQTALQKAETERQKAADQLSADSTAWTTARKALEARIAGLQTQTSVRNELDTALTSARTQLSEATKTHDAERTDWDAKRQLLEARVSELQVAADARDKLEAALTAARAELQEAVDLHAAERAIWEATRHLRGHGVPAVGQGNGRDEAGANGTVKDLELLGAYRALEARLRETTSRLHLVRRTPSAGSGIGEPVTGAADDRRQARNVEEVARLAMAMTPDITDLVSSIEKFGMRLSQQLSPATPEHTEVAAILERSQEARDLLRQLLAFMDKQAQPVITLDLAKAVKSAEPMLGWLVGAHVEFKTTLADTAPVNVHGDDFQRMLTALVLAGRDLLTVGGTVIVETSSSGAGEQPNFLTTSSDGFPALTVTASGYGVQPARVTPALEAAVRQCGGNLSIEDEPSGASRFQVVFAPARQQPAGPIYEPRDEEQPKLQSAM